MKKKSILAALLGAALFATTAVPSFASSGRGNMNVAIDPRGLSATMCGFVGTNRCRRIYADGTWDSGNWTGGFNYNITFGYGQDTGTTAMCLDNGQYIPWWAWTHDTYLSCIVMFNSGTYVVQPG